jgi:hypothetical protein
MDCLAGTSQPELPNQNQNQMPTKNCPRGDTVKKKHFSRRSWSGDFCIFLRGWIACFEASILSVSDTVLVANLVVYLFWLRTVFCLFLVLSSFLSRCLLAAALFLVEIVVGGGPASIFVEIVVGGSPEFCRDCCRRRPRIYRDVCRRRPNSL